MATPNVALLRAQDEVRFGVRRIGGREKEAASSQGLVRRSSRIGVMSPNNLPLQSPLRSATTPANKRARSNSAVSEHSMSSDPGSGKVRRAGRSAVKDSQPSQSTPQPPARVEDRLSFLKQSLADTMSKIQAGINLPLEEPLPTSLPPPPPPPVQLPPPAAGPEDLAFPELARKYKALERVGVGAFGAVYKAQRLTTHPRGEAPGQFFAVKRIAPVILPLRIITEIRFLRTHGGSHHVISLTEVLRNEGQISLVFPMFVHHHWPEFYWRISTHQILTFMHQLLEALTHIHNSHLIHRDVKPTNCLFNIETNELMLIDFGFAEFEPKYLTQHVSRVRSLMVANRAGTRGFRAPEVLLSSMEQTSAVDVWSAGVLLLSFLTARHPFFKNTSRDLLSSLCEIAALFGVREIIALAARENMTIQFPPPIDAQQGPAFATLEEFCRRYRSEDVPTFEQMQMPQKIFDLLERMLQIDPKRRITAYDALRHPVFLDAGFTIPSFVTLPRT